MIGDLYAQSIEDEPADNLLSGAIRNLCEMGLTPPVVNLTTRDVMVSQIPTSVPEKARRLLQTIAKMSVRPGGMAPLYFEKDYSLVYARDAKEFSSYIDYLVEQRLLKVERKIADSPDITRAHTVGLVCTLTIPGWEKVEADQKTNIASDRVFVAMSFFRDGDELATIYNHGIMPAILEMGYRPILIQNEEHNDEITERIIAGIRESRFVIADFSGQRQNVYYEAGLARGLGLPVV